MCDLGEHQHDAAFGYLVDTPEIRALIAETRRLTGALRHGGAGRGAEAGVCGLLAADGWLPEEYASPDTKSGMGGGIGQYALYRAEDGSLRLFSLVVPAGAETPVHDHLAWGLIGVYRGRQTETVYPRIDDGADDGRAELRGGADRKRGHRRVLRAAAAARRHPLRAGRCPTCRRSRSTCWPTTPACVWRHRFEPDTGTVARSVRATATRRARRTRASGGDRAATEVRSGSLSRSSASPPSTSMRRSAI